MYNDSSKDFQGNWEVELFSSSDPFLIVSSPQDQICGRAGGSLLSGSCQERVEVRTDHTNTEGRQAGRWVHTPYGSCLLCMWAPKKGWLRRRTWVTFVASSRWNGWARSSARNIMCLPCCKKRWKGLQGKETTGVWSQPGSHSDHEVLQTSRKCCHTPTKEQRVQCLCWWKNKGFAYWGAAVQD